MPPLSQASSKTIFHKFLDLLFPIKRSELKKFFAITAMLFCILFVQNIAKALKDSLMTTIVATEAISVLKLWGVLPAAILASLAYVKMTKHMKAESIFYTMVSFFVLSFLTFAFIIFPSKLGVDAAVKVSGEPRSHMHLFALVMQNWDCSLLYIISELWSNVVFALLFWQFVNSITSVSESKRMYILFGLLGQTCLYFSGQLLQMLPRAASFLIRKLDLQSSQTLVCIQIVLSTMAAFGISAMCLFWLLNHVIVEKELIEKFSFEPPAKSQSMVETLRVVAQSRYIRLMGLLLFSYGFAANAIECIWREKVRSLYDVPEFNMAFTGKTLKYTGVITMSLVVIGAQVIRKLGWTFAAMVPPICALLLGMLFFAAANSEQISTALACFFAVNPIILIVTIGAAQNVLAKSTKYTLFDSTKEMAYVPLEPEIKARGKACADVVGTKLGKSVCAFLQAGIFICVPNSNYDSISNLLTFFFVLACLGWIYAVLSLGREYKLAIKGRSSCP